MDLVPKLAALAARNGGVFTRAMAREAGYTERQLKTATGARGGWVVVRRGVYVERRVWDACDDAGRHRLGVHAALLTTRPGATVSHSDAAVLHGMPTRPRWFALHHLTRPDVHGGRTEGGIKHHRATLQVTDVVDRQGLATTTLARTAVDVAREHGFEDGVVTADAALRLGATRAELADHVEAGRYWPHNGRARQAVEVADGGAQSIGETLLRLMLVELGIGAPVTQFEVTDGSRSAYADLRIGRQLYEFDGKAKYLGRDEGGLADEPASAVVWREKQREDWMRRQHGGFGMSRVVWAELFHPVRRTTQRRLMQEFLETERRLGPWVE